MNQLYQQMQPQQNNNLRQQFQQFMRQFQGDPQQAIQQVMNSGKFNQSQYNRAFQLAQQFKGMFGIK